MSNLTAHFLNVGHGDCTILEHPSGRVTVIDIHNGSELDDDSESEVLSELGFSSLRRALLEGALGTRLSKNALLEKAGYNIPRTNPIEYLKVDLRVQSIWRYVQSHPEMDHMRGLAALRATFPVQNLWDTANTKTNDSFHPFYNDESDWGAYQALRDGADGASVLNLYRDYSGSYWSEDGLGGAGDCIEILSPTPELVAYANRYNAWNELSYVLRVRHSGYTIILGGDACKIAWNDIVARYGASLKCDILKASHHGRESGFHEQAVNFMKPGLTVLSVGKKPETDHHQEYNKYSNHVWSTRWKGNVVVTASVDGQMTASSQYNSSPLLWKPRAA